MRESDGEEKGLVATHKNVGQCVSEGSDGGLKRKKSEGDVGREKKKGSDSKKGGGMAGGKWVLSLPPECEERPKLRGCVCRVG